MSQNNSFILLHPPLGAWGLIIIPLIQQTSVSPPPRNYIKRNISRRPCSIASKRKHSFILLHPPAGGLGGLIIIDPIQQTSVSCCPVNYIKRNISHRPPQKLFYYNSILSQNKKDSFISYLLLLFCYIIACFLLNYCYKISIMLLCYFSLCY